MHPLRKRRGRVVNTRAPVWEPLFELVPDHVGEFMWMHEVELEDGNRLHAYKHHETRRSMYLDHGRRAFVFIWDERRDVDDGSDYEEVDPHGLLDLVLAGPDERASLFRQNLSAEFKRIRWARSATKHRVSRRRIRHALEHCLAILEEEPAAGSHPRPRETRLIFLGEDPSGSTLEVIAVETAQDNLMVIHAMDLRPRYRSTYEEVRRCNR
jgi:hypothetical protein